MAKVFLTKNFNINMYEIVLGVIQHKCDGDKSSARTSTLATGRALGYYMQQRHASGVKRRTRRPPPTRDEMGTCVLYTHARS